MKKKSKNPLILLPFIALMTVTLVMLKTPESPIFIGIKTHQIENNSSIDLSTSKKAYITTSSLKEFGSIKWDFTPGRPLKLSMTTINAYTVLVEAKEAFPSVKLIVSSPESPLQYETTIYWAITELNVELSYSQITF